MTATANSAAQASSGGSFSGEPPTVAPPNEQSANEQAANNQAASERADSAAEDIGPMVAQRDPEDSSTVQAMPSRTGGSVAFLTSLVFHVALLLVLALWAYTAGKPSEGLTLVAETGQSEEVSFELVDKPAGQPESAAQETQAEPNSDITLEVDLDNLIDLSVPQAINADVNLAASLTSVSVGNVADQLQTRGRGRGASFFGAYAEGNRFVYVLDSSTSMNGQRWVYACNQLVDSLNGLKSGQRFFVICFDVQASFLFGAKPPAVDFLDADNDTVKRVRRWLRSRTLGPSTRPAGALRVALALNPDAIFMLSDGELKDNSRAMLRKINSASYAGRRVPIHTVHLFSRSGRVTLQGIAAENDGSFTPITH